MNTITFIQEEIDVIKNEIEEGRICIDVFYDYRGSRIRSVGRQLDPDMKNSANIIEGEKIYWQYGTNYKEKTKNLFLELFILQTIFCPNKFKTFLKKMTNPIFDIFKNYYFGNYNGQIYSLNEFKKKKKYDCITSKLVLVDYFYKRNIDSLHNIPLKNIYDYLDDKKIYDTKDYMKIQYFDNITHILIPHDPRIRIYELHSELSKKILFDDFFSKLERLKNRILAKEENKLYFLSRMNNIISKIVTSYGNEQITNFNFREFDYFLIENIKRKLFLSHPKPRVVEKCEPCAAFAEPCSAFAEPYAAFAAFAEPCVKLCHPRVDLLRKDFSFEKIHHMKNLELDAYIRFLVLSTERIREAIMG